MYDELIKSLRICGDSADPIAECCYEGCIEHEDPINPFCMQVLCNRAADAIEALSKPKWIPVTERLPDEGKFVLVYGDLYPNKHDGGVIAVSKRMDWNYWQGFGRERNITHWMPLPEPPKEE